MKHRPSIEILSARSAMLTVGIGVQVHTIDRQTLAPSRDLDPLRQQISAGPYAAALKPASGSALIEINSQAHSLIADLRREMHELRSYLSTLAGSFGQMVCGGVHPLHPLPGRNDTASPQTRRWPADDKRGDGDGRRDRPPSVNDGVIEAPAVSMQLNIGCPDHQLARQLCRSWPRYLPQLIALSAASPFHAGCDTQFASARWQCLAADHWPDEPHGQAGTRQDRAVTRCAKAEQTFPGGPDMPRPDIHPETTRERIEIRVCDAPLNLDTAVDLAAYAKAITAYLLAEVPDARDDGAAFDYPQARFQAARFGFDGWLGSHEDGKTVGQDILEMIDRLRLSGRTGEVHEELNRIEQQTRRTHNDAQTLRNYLAKDRDMHAIVARQALIWSAARQGNA